MKRRIGARGLRSIVEEVCHDLMFEAPERSGESVVINEAYLDGRLEQLDATVPEAE